MGQKKGSMCFYSVNAVVSFCVGVAIFLSLWIPTTPFFAVVPVWFASVLALLFEGALAGTPGYGFRTVVFPIAAAVIFAIPFWSLRTSLTKRTKDRSISFTICLSGAIIAPIMLVAIGVAASQIGSAGYRNWGGWQVSLAAVTVLYGLALIGSGIGIGRRLTRHSGLKHALRLVLIIAGVSLASFVLLPLGILALMVVYALLGVVLLRAQQS